MKRGSGDLPFDLFVAALFEGVEDAVLERRLELYLGAVKSYNTHKKG